MERRILIVESKLQENYLKLVEMTHIAFPNCTILRISIRDDITRLPEKNMFSLALVDIDATENKNQSFVHEIRELFQGMKIVALTSDNDQECLYRLLKLGLDGYLLKGESSESFIRELQGLALGRPPLSSIFLNIILSGFCSKKKTDSTFTRSGKLETEVLPRICDGVHMLTPRESEVMHLIAKGCTRVDVAELLGISPNTSAGYIKTIYRKLSVSSRAEAVLEATRQGLISSFYTQPQK